MCPHLGTPLQALAEGFIDGMRSTPCSDVLSSEGGELSAACVSEQTKHDFLHAIASSDPCEAFFGMLKWNVARFPMMRHARYGTSKNIFSCSINYFYLAVRLDLQWPRSTSIFTATPT